MHGISQARILEWVAISLSRGSSQPRHQTHLSYGSCKGRQIFFSTTEPSGKPTPTLGRRNCIRIWYHQSPETQATGGLWARVRAHIQKLGITKEAISQERHLTQDRAREETTDSSPSLALRFSASISHRLNLSRDIIPCDRAEQGKTGKWQAHGPTRGRENTPHAYPI